MEKITLGIVSAPGLTMTISQKVKEKLAEELQKELGEDLEWNIDLEVDQVTGAAENIKEIMDQAIKIKEHHDWDFVISFTDLPIFYEKYTVLADTNSSKRAGQVSLPAFGMFSTARNAQTMFVQLVKELYYSQQTNENIAFLQHGIGIQETEEKRSFPEKVKQLFVLPMVERKRLDQGEQDTPVRFIIKPKALGKLRLILGMTAANRPWGIMPSFKRVIGIAFATGSYMLIFNTLWQLSGIYEIPRFILLMFAAMLSMVVWIIFTHNLWEKKRFYESNRLRMMYNATTVMTLSVSVLLFYMAMFLLFFIAVHLFVPTGPFEKLLEHEVSFVDYMKLAWLVSSAATVAGAVGSGLENEESVRQTTYGYRQYVRSKKVKEQEEEEQEQEEMNK